MREARVAGVVAWLGAVSGALLLMAASAFVFPGLVVAPFVGFALTFGSVAGVVLAVAATVPPLEPRALVAVLVPLGLVGAAARLGTDPPTLSAALLVGAGLLLGGTILGSVIGTKVEHPSHLFLVAAVTALADVGSVHVPGGVTAEIVAHRPTLALVAISWGLPGVGELVPVLGVGDVAMAALYLVAARRHGLSVRRTLAALGTAFIALFVALVVFEQALAALPFFSLAILAAHPEARGVRKEDRRSALLGGLIVAALFVLVRAW